MAVKEFRPLTPSLRYKTVASFDEITVNREFVEPYPAGHVPSYVLSKIADGLRLVLGI